MPNRLIERRRWPAAAAMFLLPALAGAAETGVQPPVEPISERFGFGNHADRYEARFGLLAYDRGLFSPDEYSGVVINGELLFPSPDFLSGLGSPRPYVGFDAAIADDAIHFAYAGLNWDYNLTDRVYLSASLGGAITTADDLKNPTEYKALGCRALFHLGLGLGFDLSDSVTVMAYADHFSNAELCDPNDGAEAAGVRFGYRF